MSDRNITKAEMLPQEWHWVILIFDTVHVDSGWSEREGGGTYAHPYVQYHAYLSEEEWRKELNQLFAENPGRKDVRAIPAVKPVNLSVRLNIVA